MTDTPKFPTVEIAVRTDPGRDPDKQVNEDCSVYKETAHGLLAVVCDGMGGHAGGKEASELAVRTIVDVIEAAPPATPPATALKRAIEEANLRIWQMPTAEAGFRPGSTVVAILAHEAGAEVAHVGDSRLYLVHAGAISQVTRDHSMVQELVDRNLIRAEDASKHPDSNKILRALGIGKEVEVDVRSEPVAFVTGDVFILCSDGLSDLVEPGEILQVAGSHPPAQAAGQLVDLANARGGHDNITAMVVQMKTSSATREVTTILKTAPLVAQAMGDPPGPTGTLVSAPVPGPAPLPPAAAPVPLPGPPAGAMPPLASAPPQSSRRSLPFPPAPSPASSRRAAGPRTPIVVLGIVLAVVAVGLLLAVVVVAMRPGHHAVPVIQDPPRESPLAEEDDDAGPELTVTPAPTLSVEPPAKHPHGGRHDAGHRADPCGAARRARERNAPAATITRLEEKCRASGGRP